MKGRNGRGEVGGRETSLCPGDDPSLFLEKDNEGDGKERVGG